MKEVTMNSETPKKEFWAIVSLMGHQQIAGYIEEEQIAGHGMIKVTIPETPVQKSFCRFIEPKAVYSIDPVEETVARARAAQIQYKPIDQWDISNIVNEIVKSADAASLLKLRPDLSMKALPETIKEVPYEELEEYMSYESKAGWPVTTVAEDEADGLIGALHYLPDQEEPRHKWHKKDGTLKWAVSTQEENMHEGWDIDLSTKKEPITNG